MITCHLKILEIILNKVNEIDYLLINLIKNLFKLLQIYTIFLKIMLV